MWTPRPTREERLAAPMAVAVRLIRQNYGKSVMEFAQLLGCPANTLTMYQLGRMKPGAGRLLRLLRLARSEDQVAPILQALDDLGISPADLVVTSIAPPAREEVAGVGRV
jgi:transcriptional regulator with XRE-family HTH domain